MSDIKKKIAERISQKLEEKITLENPFNEEIFPDKKEDTILNFLVDSTIRDAIEHPSIEKLVKIQELAEDK